MAQHLLERRLSLGQASAINMIDMVGIGPFITLPMVISMMNGPYFLYAWVAGGVLSFLDAMIWSELGAAFPMAGGSYNFLKEAYGKKSAGKMMSFLFVWQTMIQAPLVIASAAIGFAKYFSYLFPLTLFWEKVVSGTVVVLIIILLYRKIGAIGKISVFLWSGVIITLFWIIGGGLVHGNFLAPIKSINSGLHLDYGFVAAIGFASVKSVYSYLGYYNVCHLGSEIKNPEKNIPRSMFISIAGIGLLYFLMNVSVASVIPWQNAMHSKYIVSEFIQIIAGGTAAKIATCLILWVAFASVFSATLGYSRIPYAAADDGEFFSIFSKLHPTKHFPYVSLLFLGGIAFVFSIEFNADLGKVISAILAMRIIIQFIGQAVGLIVMRTRRKEVGFPFKMPLFPLPVILAIGMWLFILISTGSHLMDWALVIIVSGIVVYFVKARLGREWPFQNEVVKVEPGYEDD